MMFERILRCRICDSGLNNLILDLESQPLANALRNRADSFKEERYPLRLFKCDSCSLVQIDVNVDPGLMFTNYNWVTGTSKTTIQHCNNFVDASINQAGFQPETLLEIGSNDGTLLSAFARQGIELLVGVDPASNIATEYGPKMLVENLFFNSHNAQKIFEKYGKFDFVVARNVFSHIPDFLDVIEGVSKLLHTDSVFFMEFHWAHDLLTGLHYDSIYHEHTCYHSIRTVERTLEKFGLHIFNAFNSPISGGSVVVSCSRSIREQSENLKKLIEQEASAKLQDASTWSEFGRKARENIETLRNFFESNEDKRICGFGASARSSTI